MSDNMFVISKRRLHKGVLYLLLLLIIIHLFHRIIDMSGSVLLAHSSFLVIVAISFFYFINTLLMKSSKPLFFKAWLVLLLINSFGFIFTANFSFPGHLGQLYVFYDKKEATEWARKSTFPKVFKLTGGAGAANVKLVRTKNEAVKLINKAFGRGFSQFNRFGNLKERYRKWRSGKDSLFGVVKGVGRIFIPTEYAKMQAREKGYVYFQEFIENDGYDVRVVVIGSRAVALKRLVRENDFRASGSGNLIFENENIDKTIINHAFKLARKMKSQSLAVDFIKRNSDNKIFVVEVSYGFPMNNFLEGSSGYWDSEMNWHEGRFNPQDWMVNYLINN